MAKTHHRRRHRRANRTRRGGAKSNPVSPRAAPAAASAAVSAAASAFPDMEAIKARVREIAAQGASHVSKKPKKTISKKEADRKAAETRLRQIMDGKLKHSDKSAFKGSVISDSQAARVRGYGV
jgi:hypothetical protein